MTRSDGRKIAGAVRARVLSIKKKNFDRTRRGAPAGAACRVVRRNEMKQPTSDAENICGSEDDNTLIEFTDGANPPGPGDRLKALIRK